MQRKRLRLYFICLAMGLAASLVIVTASCSGNKASTTNTSTTSTTQTATTSTTQAALASINVTPSSPDNSDKLGIGAKQQFVATGSYADGSSKDISSQVTWSSSDNNIATVDSNGIATGAAVGATQITASSSGITGSGAPLNVVYYTSITVTPGAPSNLQVGFPMQFVATGKEANGTNADITTQVAWTSSKSGVAAIDQHGLALGAAAGTTAISAALAGITSDQINLTVVPATTTTTATSSTTTTATSATTGTTTTTTELTITSITVSPDSTGANVEVGSTLQFKATGSYSDGSTKDVTSQVAWTSSDNTIATIDPNGLASGVAAGFSNITATVFGKVSTPVTLLVMNPIPPLSTITIAPVAPDNSASLTAGSTQRFTATGTYADSSTRDITSVVTWTSSTTAAATVDTNGLVTGVAAGTTNITASMNGKTSTAVKVTVTAVSTTTTTTTTPTP